MALIPITNGAAIGNAIKACLLQDPCWTMLCECCDCGELLINGGFEQGYDGGDFAWIDDSLVNGWSTAHPGTNAGETDIEFWHTGKTTPVDPSGVDAYEGSYFIEQQGHNNHGWGVTQDVTLSVGTEYTLDFYYRSRTETASNEEFTVDITGESTTTISDSSTGSWTAGQIVFTASASTTTITFDPTNQVSTGCFLDGVSLKGPCCENGPPAEEILDMLALSLSKIKNHYIPIEIGDDVFKAKANVNIIDPEDTIQRNDNLINWDSNSVDHFVFTSTKNPIVFKKDKHIFQYKDKWIALLLINLEQIPCPICTYEYVLNTRKTNENKPSGFILVVKDGIYKSSDFTLKNLSNAEKLENVNLVSSPNNIF